MGNERFFCLNCGHGESVHRSGGLCEACVLPGDSTGSGSSCQGYVAATEQGFPVSAPEREREAAALAAALAASEALIADWLARQAAAEAAKAFSSATTNGGLYHGARAGALREAAEAVRQGRARREGGA